VAIASASRPEDRGFESRQSVNILINRPKILAKKLSVLVQNTTSFYKKMKHKIGLKEKRQFVCRNWRKSQKIVIIISTTGSRFESASFEQDKKIRVFRLTEQDELRSCADQIWP
jgi:hypothetical protein